MAQLNYKTLRQEVADEIRRKILKGEFKAGERIKEHEMAQLLGVSRGPVREALRVFGDYLQQLEELETENA